MRVSNESARGLEQSRESGKSSKAGEVQGKRQDRRTGKAADATEIESNDKVQLSNKGRDVAKAKAMAVAAPDVNEEKVEKLKRAVQSGNYNIDAEKIADRLVDEHINTMY